jgi:hypothetical protein
MLESFIKHGFSEITFNQFEFAAAEKSAGCDMNMLSANMETEAMGIDLSTTESSLLFCALKSISIR